MNYTKEEILSFLTAEKEEILDLMKQTVNNEENNTITYSKNIFIPLTEICRNDCGYCNFKKTPEDEKAIILKDMDEILEELKIAEKQGCKEALFTFGEDADESPAVVKALEDKGF